MTGLIKENKLTKAIDDTCDAFEDSQKEVGRLERENAKLRARISELEEQLYGRFDERADMEAGE